MDEPKVKKLLGSISFGVRLEILEAFESLQDIFVRVELYDRRRIIKEMIIDNFEALVEVITDFWDKEAKLAIYPRKMAAWLSDYLNELGYPAFDFNYVYRAITHKLEEDKELALLANLIELKDPDIKPKMQKVDMDLPGTDRGSFLAKEIDKFLEEAPKKTKSTVVYVNQEGKVETILTEPPILMPEEDDKTKLLTTTGFENPLDIPLVDVQINNVIPYHYKVSEINTIGFEGVTPAKKLLDDGLQLTWIIPEIKPKQETKIEVNLERRIARTILMNIEKDVNIINTYFNIEPFKDRFSASNSFTNVQADIIDNLIIEDEIPTTFNLLEVKPPDDEYKMNMEKEGFEQLLKWQYEEIATEKEIRHLYYLIDRRIFLLTEFLIRSRQNQEPIMQVIRFIEPNVRYYEIIVSYYLKFHEPISELYIKESIPESVNVTFLFPNSVEKSIEIVESKTKQVWKILLEAPSTQFEFGYICSGECIKTEFPVDIYIPQLPVSSSEELSAEIQKKPFFLPEMHQFLQQFKTSAIVRD